MDHGAPHPQRQHRVGVRMALLEIGEVREFGMLEQTPPDILGGEKVSHWAAVSQHG